MSQDTDKSESPDSMVGRRQYERVLGKIQVKLVAGGQSGPVLLGFTRDISLKGFFVEFMRPPTGMNVGDQVQVELGQTQDKKVVTCRVAHVRGRGVGMEIESSPAEVARVFSALLFSENQLRLGTELSLQEQKTVVVHGEDGVSQEARIDKISVSQLDCLLDETLVPLEVGQAVSLSIPVVGGKVLSVSGVVRKVDSGIRQAGVLGTSNRVAVLFSSMPEALAAELRALVGQFYQNRLDRMMRAWLMRRPANLGLIADEEITPLNRSQLERQLDQFFGHIRPVR